MPRKAKPLSPGSPPDIESMIRVDHAGEYGAVRIYEGQLAVLKRRKTAAVQAKAAFSPSAAVVAPSAKPATRHTGSSAVGCTRRSFTNWSKAFK